MAPILLSVQKRYNPTMMTKILLIDTTTQYASVALCVENRVYTRFNDRPRAQAQVVLPMIEAVCVDAELPLSAIEMIAVAVGPGSFTGVRLSLSVAKALAFALNCPLMPISTLDIHRAYLLNQTPNARTAVAIDARMGQVYAQIDDGDPYLCDPDAFWHDINQSADKGPFLIIGTGWAAYPALIEQAKDAQITLETTHQNVLPPVESAYDWVKAQAQQSLSDWRHCEPLYLRNTVVHTKK